MKQITIEKIKDTRFNGYHLNGIFEGFTIRGFFKKLEVGEMLYIFENKTVPFFHTSIVTKINEDTFETLNSVYKYEIKE